MVKALSGGEWTRSDDNGIRRYEGLTDFSSFHTITSRQDDYIPGLFVTTYPGIVRLFISDFNLTVMASFISQPLL